ncbi:hypothetical protein WBP_0247 [Wolbachia endosymbiont of Brugia pahangi]|nr:hypothetical protein WBP_0247 [Wolbachia endosymbiont of Brugia pahangi]
MFYYKEMISKLPKEELGKMDGAVDVNYRVSKFTGKMFSIYCCIAY